MSQDTGLTVEQECVVSLCLQGLNVFFTGSAGTGKTKTLKEIASCLGGKFGDENVGRTATTGLASTPFQGQTIHSWSGLGIGRGSRYKLLRNVLANPAALDRWVKCKALIIDEVSMLDCEAFDALEFIARKTRVTDLRFGGIQLIVCGDFQQLLPVTDLMSDKNGDQAVKFCFQSSNWNSCIDANIRLTQIHRQRDPEMLLLLSEVKNGGDLSPSAHNLLSIASRNSGPLKHPETVFLYPRKKDVELKNFEILQSRHGEEFVSKAKDTGLRHLLKNCPFPETLVFKVGAKVMLLRNMHKKGLVNGSIGNVEAVFNGNPMVKFDTQPALKIGPYTWGAVDDNGVTRATRRQIPLQLAWAMSIHKSQGQTISSLVVSLNGLFVHGQAYVALSRCCSLSGLSVMPGWDHKFPLQPLSIKEFCANIINALDFRRELSLLEYRSMPSTLSDNMVADEDSNLGTQCNIDGGQLPTLVNFVLPDQVNLIAILQACQSKECRSEEYLVLANEIAGKIAEHEKVREFAAFAWHALETIYAESSVDVACDIKEAFGDAHLEKKEKLFIALKVGKEMIRKWTEVLVDLSLLQSTKDKLTHMQRTLMVDIISCLRVRLAGMMQDKLTSADQETLQIIPETLSNPEKGKVRFLAGWVAFKEQSTCSNYITRNTGSKHKHVQNNTKVEIALLKVIKGMICSRDEVMRNTRAKDTLKHMEYHNRGGLTHVRDEVFLFFERMELCCQRIFTRPLIQQYRDQALLHARKLVKEDPLLLIAWRSMLRSCHFCDNSFDSREIPESEGNKEVESVIGNETLNVTDIGEMLYKRFLRRYLNMRSKEFLAQMKQEVKAKKDHALREALSETKTKSKTSASVKQLLDGVFEDKSPNKLASHLKLKAFALTGDDAFVVCSKVAMHFFLLHDLEFRKSKKKKELSGILCEKLKLKYAMDHPKLATHACFDLVQRYNVQGKQLSLADAYNSLGIRLITTQRVELSAGVVDMQPTEETNPDLPNQQETAAMHSEDNHRENRHLPIPEDRESVDDDTSARGRLKRFKPTHVQLAVLEQDNAQFSGKPSKLLLKQRSQEFSVDMSQIQRWHKVFNKRKPVST